jgi:hypothetical protein
VSCHQAAFSNVLKKGRLPKDAFLCYHFSIRDNCKASEFKPPTRAGRALIPNNNKSKLVPALSIAIWVLSILAMLTQISPAGLDQEDTTSRVEIEGIQYGPFDQIDGLPERADGEEIQLPSEGGYRIRFVRDFVTDPSLYQWAKNTTHNRSELKDIRITIANRDGETFITYILRQCQPLSWTVEAANPALGGFHETVEVAVQGIEIE